MQWCSTRPVHPSPVSVPKKVEIDSWIREQTDSCQRGGAWGLREKGEGIKSQGHRRQYSDCQKERWDGGGRGG